LLLFLLTSNIVSSQNIVETFHRSGFNNSSELAIFDDNTFVLKYRALSCVVDKLGKKTASEEFHGDYTLKKNKLHLSPKYKLYKGYEDKEIRRSDEYILEGGFFIFSYDILVYNGEKILLAAKQLSDSKNNNFRFDNHYIYLANLLNKSEEETYFDSNFWRGNKALKRSIKIRKDIKDIFPEGYKDYILDKPINCQVKKVDEISFLNPDLESNPNRKKYRITLDVGKSDGIKPMMILYGEKDCNGNRCSITIQDVYKNECSGYVHNYSPQYNCSLEKTYSTKKTVL